MQSQISHEAMRHCSSEAENYVRISLAASQEDIERGVREICAFADR